MSKLRKQLQQARTEYESLRYRGDLAAEVLGQVAPTRSHWVRNLSIAAALALVATAGIVLMSRQAPTTELADNLPGTKSTEPVNVDPTDPGDSPGTAVATTADEQEVEEAWSLVPGGSATVLETAVSFVPSYQSISFSLPSVEGIDAYDVQDESTTNQ